MSARWCVAFVSIGLLLSVAANGLSTNFMNAVKPAINEDPFSPEHSRMYLIPSGKDAGQVDNAAQEAFSALRKRTYTKLEKLSTQNRKRIEALYEDGMKVTPLGLNMTSVYRKRGRGWSERDMSFNMDHAVMIAFQLMVVGVDKEDAHCLDTLWNRDNFVRYPKINTQANRPAMPGLANRMKDRGIRRRRAANKKHWRLRLGRSGNHVADFLQGLGEDGFAFYSQIVGPEHLPKLRAAVNTSLVLNGERSSMAGGPEVVTRLDAVNVHKRLDRVICNGALQQAARKYMGGAAYLEHVRLVRLGAGTLQPQDHSDVLWHHSGVGRKLLVVVFLDDPKPGSRGIEVVQSSHHLHYYTAHHRHIDDAAIHRAFPDLTVELFGQAGDALMLDGNLLHRDVAKATHPRDVAILEFVDWNKYDMMAETGCSKLSREDFNERVRVRDETIHLSCPSPVLELVQESLTSMGLPKLGLVQATVMTVVSISMVIFVIFDYLRRTQDPVAEAAKRKRNQFVPPRRPLKREKGIFRRPKRD